jgi:two-component system osmolarity sensor histidine kinase EnvZ
MTLRLLPRSLLARTTLVIMIALAASQVVSMMLFNYYSQAPRAQMSAIRYIAQLRTIRAALETLPADQHDEFLKRLREERGLRVIRPRADEVLDLAPDVPALQEARERLRREFGKDADVFVRRNVNPGQGEVLIVKLIIDKEEFWIVSPRSRVVERDFSWAWIGWATFGGILALAGAIFLVSRVTRPLRQLAEAARQLGQGKNPQAVAEIGPDEVKSVAAAFNQMRDDLAQSDRQRATFLAGVSHDLRTPLSRLRLGIEMLPADPATRSDLEQDIDDINGVIDQFMDFARDESREALEPIDLNMLVRTAASRAERAGAKIDLDLAAIPAIPMRPLSMRRLVNNLLDNAIKHAGSAADAITLRTSRQGGQIIFSVLDRGPGIAANEVERLKQPFTRLDEARSGKSGAGLGLAIVDRIVKTHGGNFNLLPRDGGGLEARISLAIA